MQNRTDQLFFSEIDCCWFVTNEILIEPNPASAHSVDEDHAGGDEEAAVFLKQSFEANHRFLEKVEYFEEWDLSKVCQP